MPRRDTLHREGLVDQRRDRPPAPRRHQRPAHAARHRHRGQRELHLGLGSPDDYCRASCCSHQGEAMDRDDLLRELVDDPVPAQRRRTSTAASSACAATRSRSAPPQPRTRRARRVLRRRDRRRSRIDPLTGERHRRPRTSPSTRPCTTSPAPASRARVREIQRRADERLRQLRSAGQAARGPAPRQRTHVRHGDAASEIGFCPGIENYSRHLTGTAARQPRPTPARLLSRTTTSCSSTRATSRVPQIHGMYQGDRSRKQTLVDYGFRLPARPGQPPAALRRVRGAKAPQIVFVSRHARRRTSWREPAATSSSRSFARRGWSTRSSRSAPRPARSTTSSSESRRRVERDERVLITTLTKRMSEDLTDFLVENGLRVRYLHSEIDTLQRLEIAARAAPGRVRHTGRHQPAARGARPARGHPGRHP